MDTGLNAPAYQTEWDIIFTMIIGLTKAFTLTRTSVYASGCNDLMAIGGCSLSIYLAQAPRPEQTYSQQLTTNSNIPQNQLSNARFLFTTFIVTHS